METNRTDGTARAIELARMAESRQRKTEGQPQREGFLGTAWTMVMDLTHPSVTYYSLRHFDKPFHFELGR